MAKLAQWFDNIVIAYMILPMLESTSSFDAWVKEMKKRGTKLDRTIHAYEAAKIVRQRVAQDCDSTSFIHHLHESGLLQTFEPEVERFVSFADLWLPFLRSARVHVQLK